MSTSVAPRPAPRSEGAAGTSPAAVRRHVGMAAAITALGGLLFGYDTGVVSGALLFIKKDFGGCRRSSRSWSPACCWSAAVVGALAAGRVADKIGRRPR